jgi:hypothetical protein
VAAKDDTADGIHWFEQRRPRPAREERWDLPSGRVAPVRRGSFQAHMRSLLRAKGGLRSSARGRSVPTASNARRVVVKARVVQVGHASGLKAAQLHLRYLERDGVDRDGAPGALYDATGPVDRAAFNEEMPGESHQFRLIVSPEDGHALDLRAFVRDYMQQVEKDLGRELKWAAVDHYNTDNPHSHIVIRGVDAHGAELRLDRAYISHGLRRRAEELVTDRLGPRPERTRLDQLKREAELERYTSLDRELERRARGAGFRPAGGKSRDPHLDAALRTRLEVLERLGLASASRHGEWRLDPDLRTRLQVMGRHAEGVRVIRSVLRAGRCRVIDRAEPNTGHAELDRGVAGVVRWKGLDEDGHFVAVVETARGIAYHLPVNNRVASDVRVGQLVELKRAFDKDSLVEETARAAGGVFDLGQLPEASREAYRRRLEQLERVALASRDPNSPQHWVIRADFRQELAKGKQQPLWQMLSVRAEAQSLADQPRYRGPVWLDRVQLDEVGSGGFAQEVGAALKARHEYLRSAGLEPGAPRLHWKLLKLQQAELERAVADRGGIAIRAADGFEGTVHVHHAANGQRFVEVRSASGRFALLSAPRDADTLQGRTVRLGIGEDRRPRLDLVERDRGYER